ncbi:MAG: right-handed parallel beta-helix repeat-containing protein [Pirellulaceae bacterium]|nr:right-handed parallel beta-helix repeat-containing protein [Pirellulaceae bacterium]
MPQHGWSVHSGSIYKTKLPSNLIAPVVPGQGNTGWSPWSPTGDSVMVLDSACPGQASACMAFTSGNSTGTASSNIFSVFGGTSYTAGIQFRAPPGSVVRIIIRRAGPTYEQYAPDQWVTASGSWQSVNYTFQSRLSLANARMDVEIPANRIKVHLREAFVQHIPSETTSSGAVFVNGLQSRRAHHPNFGQNATADSPYQAITDMGGRSTLDASALSLPTGATLNTSLRVTLRTKDWALEERGIAIVAGRRLTLASPTEYDILPGYGYFLTGALWMLDTPGEWFYDSASTTLYLWPPDGIAPGGRVSVNTLPMGIDLRNRSYVNVSGLAVSRVDTGVALSGGKAIALVGLNISDVTDRGIDAENCITCAVRDSVVARTGLDAISVRGPLTTGFQLSDSAVIDSGTSARSDGWRWLPRPAVAAVHSVGAASSITGNTIAGSSNLGIYLGPQSTASANFVTRTCLTLNDCGGIYANATGDNATIVGNLIESLQGNIAGVPATQLPLTIGIYLDDHNDGSVVAGNTVTGAGYGIGLHNARGATVSNNILAGNRQLQIWAHEDAQKIRGAGDIFGNAIYGNTLVSSASGPAVYLISKIGDTADFATFNSNHYSALLSPRVVGEVLPTGSNSYTVNEWAAAGRETNARATQPVGYASFLVGSDNLIPNTDFANSYQGWIWWNATPPLASIQLNTCTVGPCLTLFSGSTNSMLGSPAVSIVAGRWYRVSFDAKTGSNDQSINVMVRRGGGGTAGKEPLIPVAESFAGSTSWRRYSFAFQATKTVIAGDPVTQERGAGINFESNLPGRNLSVAKLEMVELAPAQVTLQTRVLLNRNRTSVLIDCSSLGVAQSLCGSFVYFDDDSPVTWPAPLAAFTGRPIYTRDTSLNDSDNDGIADRQDYCPNSPAGAGVNSRGCALGQ